MTADYYTLMAVWAEVMRASRDCGDNGDHSDYHAGVVRGATRVFALLAGIPLGEATRRVQVAIAFGGHR